MAIPESQLEIWTNQGAIQNSAATHKSVRAALDNHAWLSKMTFDTYLQGSYANSTNIRGNSDVDLVVETDGVFYNNLTQAEKEALKLSPGSFNFSDFRQEVIAALENYFGEGEIDSSGNKSLKIGAGKTKLDCDVIPCCQYRHYTNMKQVGTGIQFFSKNTGNEIINFPKDHLSNGVNKNSSASGNFKSTVRMFKNAREKLGSEGISTGGVTSYFLECLLYNVPNNLFGGTTSERFVNILNYLVDISDEDLKKFRTQSGWYNLFGNTDLFWSTAGARHLISGYVSLWNDWE